LAVEKKATRYSLGLEREDFASAFPVEFGFVELFEVRP
jgi:hypothetical protein